MNANLDKLINDAVSEVLAKKSDTTKYRVVKNITLSMARELIYKVEEKASEMGVKAVVAVSDASARIIAVECMDDAYIASYDVAVNKTFTCASLKMSTKKLSTLATPGAPLYGIQFTNQGKIVIFGGGEVLKCGEEIVGAVGISGGSEEQDTALADYAKQVFENMI
ncbi:MAG: heme-binding protein [Ruminococcaceae bacterium]|nr:heme-binding protein [Oscillospiraceae bacterium]